MSGSAARKASLLILRCRVVNRSVLNVERARIISPSNDSFILNMTGVVTHTGIFSAVITFTKPMNVTWIDGEPDSDNKRPLGYMSLDALHASHKRATLNQQSMFYVTDQEVNCIPLPEASPQADTLARLSETSLPVSLVDEFDLANPETM